jgi:predicted DNA-binding transcriptional regulator AlpA
MPTAVTQATTHREPLAFTVDEFAEAYRLSRATLYNLWRDGAGPTRMRVRGRVLISWAAAEDWRREVEQAVAT